jgi:hypothetical protein
MANYNDIILSSFFFQPPRHLSSKKAKQNKKTVAFPTETGQVPQIKNSWHFEKK